ncbi:MAG: DUF2769 domain-containing protein [Methanosarcina sp.]
MEKSNKPSAGTGSRVPYKRENIERCMCSQCPVQQDSKCAKEKLQSSGQKMKNMPAGEVPNPEDVPGIYCSTGKATCQDLDFNRECICGSCEVWKECNLSELDLNNHFCLHGKAT